MMTRIIKKLLLSRFLNVFRILDKKYKNVLDKYKSIWKIKAFKLKFNNAASLIIRLFRRHRISKIRKSCNLIKTAMRVIMLRKFFYNCNKNKFYKQFNKLLKKTHQRLLDSLKDNFNIWKAQCDFSILNRQQKVLKSKRPAKIESQIEIKKSLSINPSCQKKYIKSKFPYLVIIRLQNIFRKLLLKKDLEKKFLTDGKINETIDNKIFKNVTLKNLLRYGDYKSKNTNKELLSKKFRLFKEKTSFINPEDRNPISIKKIFPLFFEKSTILNPIKAANKIIHFFNVVRKIQNIKLIQNVAKMKRLDELKKLFAVRRLQNKFRIIGKKIKFSHKLYKIIDGIHRHVTEKIHRKFLLWVKHLLFKKLSMGMKLIIDLMRQNSNYREKNYSMQIMFDLGNNCKSIQIKKISNIIRLCAQKGQNKLKIIEFLERINYKEAYKFIGAIKENSSKLNKFNKNLRKFYKRKEKNDLSSRFRKWANLVLKNKVIIPNFNFLD